MGDLLGEDPAAEFLQQEEDQLRELGIDENQFNEPSENEPPLGSDDISGFIGGYQDETTTTLSEEPMVNGFNDDLSSQIASLPVEEPESLRVWREERVLTLQKQEEEEKEAATAWADKAKKELEDWYNHYNEQLEKVKVENRLAQKQFVEEMTDTKPGNTWEKVSRYCDFNPKFSKNTKDVSRMRGLLLQLKQKPLVR